MAKAEVLEVLGRRPFEARTGSQAAGGSSFAFEVRTGEVKTQTHNSLIICTQHIYGMNISPFSFSSADWG